LIQNTGNKEAFNTEIKEYWLKLLLWHVTVEGWVTIEITVAATILENAKFCDSLSLSLNFSKGHVERSEQPSSRKCNGACGFALLKL